MTRNKAFVSAVFLFLALPRLSGGPQLQMDSIYRFRGVRIPETLTFKGAQVEGGLFDLEIMMARDSGSLCLRFIRKGKIVGHTPGQEWTYAGRDTVPAKPTLHLARDFATGQVVFTFESGREHPYYPMLRAEFRVPFALSP